MTIGMRVRLWAQQAPVADKVRGSLVLAVTMAVLAFAVYPTTSRSRRPEGVSAVGVPPGDAPSTNPTTAAATENTVDGLGGLAGSGATGPGRGTRSQGAAGAHGAAGPSGTVAPGVKLLASDQGVTPQAVKIGVLIINIGGIQGAGVALGLRTDIPAVIKAYVDYFNSLGGVAGRRIDYVARATDPLSASDQQQACVSMTEDNKVFAVLDVSSTQGAGTLCYGQQHHVPLLQAGTTQSAEYVEQNFPYFYSANANGSRLAANWANYASADGNFNFPPGHTLGVLADACAPQDDILDHALLPTLSKLGVKPFVVKLSCDKSTAQEQTAAAVLDMQQHNVDLVYTTTFFANFQVFLEHASAQQWFPKYSVSDFGGYTSNVETANFNAREFDGAQGVTTWRVGLKVDAAAIADCNKALKAAGVPLITDPYGADTEAGVQCDNFHMFIAAMNKAAPNPTRLAWGQVGQTLGEFPSAMAARAVLGKGKTTGGDALGRIQWKASCKCWTSVVPPTRPAYV